MLVRDAMSGVAPEAVHALVQGQHGDPFSILGHHAVGGGRAIRAFLPGALGVDVVAREDGSRLGTLEMVHPSGLFAGVVQATGPYRLRIRWPEAVQETEDLLQLRPPPR